MRVLDLFSGIGGFSLGLERAGMTTVAFCEIDPFCRRVLAKHWPTVPIFEDVRTMKGSDVEAVDVICGGFPCQDISTAGKGAGLAGERSGLWREYARLIGELRPAYVIVENVAALLGRGLGTVLGDLAALGYDAEWHCIPASAVGAPHLRDRIWIVAYPNCGSYARELDGGTVGGETGRSAGRDAGEGETPYRQRLRIELGASSQAVADAAGERRGEAWEHRQRPTQRTTGGCEVLAHSNGCDAQRVFPESNDAHDREKPSCRSAGLRDRARAHSGWQAEPDVGRVAHGVPARVDRLRGLGNAVVPQIPEIIGRAIMAATSHHHTGN